MIHSPQSLIILSFTQSQKPDRCLKNAHQQTHADIYTNKYTHIHIQINILDSCIISSHRVLEDSIRCRLRAELCRRVWAKLDRFKRDI